MASTNACSDKSEHCVKLTRSSSELEKCSDLARMLIEESKKELMQSFGTLEARCRVEGNEIYHHNQEATAVDVANSILYDPAVVFQLVKAMTQTGKTGCMLAVIKSCFTLSGCEIKVNPDNIFIITGISSTDWTEQTKKRFPKALKDNIYHRGELKTKLAKRLTGLRDVVILMDEVHVASKDDMTISKLLETTGLKNMEYLREQNINFVEFSATPNKVMEDMTLWEEYAKQHVMQPGAGYKGVHHQLENGRVFQAKDLFIAPSPCRIKLNEKEYNERKKRIAPAYVAIRELKEKINGHYNKPLYHIIRLPSGEKFDEVVSRFKEVFGDEEFYHAPCHTNATENDVQNLIQDIPAKHTLIYIKEHLRCAVTLSPKANIGILYERISGNDDVMIQGLSGRATGYDVHDNMLVYTNIESLERYKKVWESGFSEQGDLTYQGTRTKKAKPSVFHPSGFSNSGIEPTEIVHETRCECSELNFVLSLTDEEITSITPEGNVGAKHKGIALNILKNHSEEKWADYNTYTPRLWANADCEKNRSKWMIDSMMVEGSTSNGRANMHKKYKTVNILCMYLCASDKKLVFSPWSGKKMSEGAAEPDERGASE